MHGEIDQGSIDSDSQMFTLADFAEMAGFPVELVKKELFLDEHFKDDEPLPLPVLRQAMVSYLNKSMI